MLGSSNTVGFVPSIDLKRSRSFYEDILGLRFVKDDGFALIFEAGQRSVRIANVCQVPDFKPLPFTVLGWEVKDVSKIAAGLNERGVKFEKYQWMEQDALGVWSSPTGDKVAWFKDPDGNILSISQHA